MSEMKGRDRQTRGAARRAVAGWSGAVVSALLGACDPSPSRAVDASTDAPCVYCQPTCPTPAEAPLAGVGQVG